MAYDIKREQKGSPYDDVASGGSSSPYPAASSAPIASAAPAATPFAAAQQGTAQRLGPDTGPSATGYVNFDRLYGANAEVAGREAGKRANAAQGAAQGAQKALTGAQGAYQSQLTGATNTGPNASDYGYATGQTKFRVPAPTNAKRTVDNGPNATETGEGLTSTETRNGPAGAQPIDSPNPNALNEGEWRAGIEAGAKKGFGNAPNALSADTDAYTKLLQGAESADQQIANPTTGLGQTDAALLGAAGRPRFAELQAQYGGQKAAVESANKASIAQNATARAQTAQSQSDYDRLLADYDAKHAGDAAAADSAKPKPIVINAAPGVGGGSPLIGVTPETQAAWDALPLETKMAQGGATKSFEQITNSGDRTLDGLLQGTYGVDKETAALIREKMTPEEWAEYQQAIPQGSGAVIAWVQKMTSKVRKPQ